MNVREHNRIAWDRQVEWGGNPWTIPVSSEEIQAARQGQWVIYLSPTKPVPHAWLAGVPGKSTLEGMPSLEDRQILCLASGGGQQGPILAAAGAQVTVLDNSPRQLGQDRLVAEHEGLEITLVEGDMAHLDMFPDESFDFIVHPVSNVFAAEILPVWREAYRVLRCGGILVAGFNNPALHLFDYDQAQKTGQLVVTYQLPYSDAERLNEAEQQRFLEGGNALEFSHTLEEQIGGQIAAGFLITGLYEDYDRDPENNPLSRFMPTYIATRAVKI